MVGKADRRGTAGNREMNWRSAPSYPPNRRLRPYREQDFRGGIAQKGYVNHGNLANTVKPVRRDNAQHRM
jgi:hypothetical protein